MSDLRIGVLHGPNLNLLGQRRPEVYGTKTLEEIDARLAERAADLGVVLDVVQSNHEGTLVDWIQKSASSVDGRIVNAAAYTHTSVALRDALEATAVPFVEVHLSNIFAREGFRQRSLLSDLAVGVVTGFGSDSYVLALDAFVNHLRGGQ